MKQLGCMMCLLLFCIMQADYDSMICSHNLRSSSALTFTSHHIPQTSRMRSRTRRITTHNLLLIPHTSLHLITFYNPVNQKETSSSQKKTPTSQSGNPACQEDTPDSQIETAASQREFNPTRHTRQTARKTPASQGKTPTSQSETTTSQGKNSR